MFFFANRIAVTTSRALTAAITNPDHAAAKRAFEAMMEMGKIDIAAIEAARRG
jgi:2-polyprenyl-6-hydroxyphenyl methylase/3-demethylubiquinone-9 3-methyltransferase